MKLKIIYSFTFLSQAYKNIYFYVTKLKTRATFVNTDTCTLARFANELWITDY